MSRKNFSPTFEHQLKVLKLLKKRSKYVDSRSYKYFYGQISNARNDKLDKIELVLKKIKKIPDAVLTKKTFKPLLESIHQKVYKVTIYANYEIKHPKKKTVVSKQEAVDTFEFKGKKSQLKKIIKEKTNTIRNHHDEANYYTNEIKVLRGFSYQKSSVHMSIVQLSQIPMNNAFTLSRNWLKYAEGISSESYKNMNGQCVYELLCSHLGDYWKTITKEKLFDVFNEYHQQNNRDTYSLDIDAFLQSDLTMESGVTTEMIKYLCNKKKISLYAFDSKENCFECVKFPSISNYKPIIYYLIDGHMYLINDPKTIRSVSESQKAKKNVIVSSLLQVEQEEKKTEQEMIECNNFSEAILMENKVVFIPKIHINDEVREYIRVSQSVPQMKVINHQIVAMTIKGKNLTINADLNICDGYSWKDIKSVCEKADIPFTNQQIGGLINCLKKKFFKTERRFLSDEEKASLIKNQLNKCKMCDEVQTKFEYDHIIPLVLNGSNDIENFQALCAACHLQKTVQERENSDFIKFDDCASSFNSKSLEVIKSFDFKQWAFVEKLYEKFPTKGKFFKIDHSKCRRNLVMYGNNDFPMYSVMDYPSEYDGSDIKCGNYYVETENYFPFRGNGWYNYTILKYAQSIDIEMKITHQFIPSFTIKHDHFQNFSKFMVDITSSIEGCNLPKLIVNSLVGCWGIQRSEFESIRMTLDKYEASRELSRDGVFVSSSQLDDVTTLYSVIEKKVINKDDMYLPLYYQIVAMEAIELHKLEQMIIVSGGRPLERNTDAILYKGNKIDISEYFWDENKTVSKYRYEDDYTLLNRDNVCKLSRENSFKPHKFVYRKFKDDDKFDEICEKIMKSNKGCLINGIAGTGKTYLANMLIEKLEKNGKKLKMLAPTNKAAEHIKGETIHKFYLSLFLSNNYEKKLLNNLGNIDYIIIDEISMVKEVFYRFFTLIKRFVPNVKFIIIGDFKQLKPVNDIYSGSYVDSPALFDLVDGQRIVLKKCRRSDDKLFNLYTNIDKVNIDDFEFKKLTKLNIAYCHNTRKRVNKLCMERFTENKTKFMIAKPSKFNNKTQESKIFVGLPIVSYRNNKKLQIHNSEMFKVSKIDEENQTFSFMDGDTEQTMHVSEFSYMFYPAFCITVHVSQGCTFKEAYTIWDWDFLHMDETAKYVALSRSTCCDNIQIKK